MARRSKSSGADAIGLLFGGIIFIAFFVWNIVKELWEFLTKPPGVYLTFLCLAILGIFGLVADSKKKKAEQEELNRNLELKVADEEKLRRESRNRLERARSLYSKLDFFFPLDHEELLKSLSVMTFEEWVKYVSQLEEKLSEKQDFSSRKEHSISKTEESLRQSSRDRAKSISKAGKTTEPNQLTIASPLFDIDTDTIFFYENFLDLARKMDPPIDIYKLKGFESYQPQEPSAIAKRLPLQLNSKNWLLRPDQRESRFYNDGKFNLSSFQEAEILWTKATEEFENDRKNFEDKSCEEYMEDLRFTEEMYKFREECKRKEELDSTFGSLLRAVEKYEHESPIDFEIIADFQLRHFPWPNYFPRKWHIKFDEVSKLMLIDFGLPLKESLAFIKERKILKTKDQIKIVKAAAKAQDQVYSDFLYQVSLSVVNLIFKCDYKATVDSIVFNGMVEAADTATGIPSEKCILSFIAPRAEFTSFKLDSIVPVECFKRLKGVSSSSLSKLTPIRPLLQFNKTDKRFIEATEVLTKMEGLNIASIHWADFETLVRDVFSREFNGEGAEVKVTRASKDGGVDAVIFDPDPIKGGKFVIQAKRYTNIVGVSAVRDLYGTVLNEGANRGILVSTSHYGPDAYDFAADKPITLINGGELLHLLKKHGIDAHIDLNAAKEIAKRA